MKKYWLVKTEPETYSWQHFISEGKAVWDGVRNYQARNNLKEMKKGDLVLFYHSVSEKQVVGIARVQKEHYPEPGADKKWVVVELVPEHPMTLPVTLEQIKKDERLLQIPLLRQTRLSVVPLKREEFDAIVQLGEKQ